MVYSASSRYGYFEMDLEQVQIEDLTFDMVDGYSFATCYTREHSGSPMRDLDIAAAILISGGNYAHIGRLLGRRRSSVVDKINSTGPLRTLFLETRDGSLDELEAGVMRSAIGGNESDRRFVLSTIGKDRGYSTRQQLADTNDQPLAPSLYNLDKLSVEDLERLERILTAAESSEADPQSTES